MLNPFPELLAYGFFAPTLLRVAAGLVFLYVASQHYARREAFGEINFPLVGHKTWTVWFAIVVEVVVGAMLVAGYYTQIAALVGVIAAAKYFFFRRYGPSFAPLSSIASVLLLVICLSLLLSGAGALAFDLPL